jgi:hypothetical protein
MLTVFEVYIQKTADAERLLSDETRLETNAKVMTLEQAERAGFSGFQPQRDKGQLRIVVVESDDARWIVRALEYNESVLGYQIHEV